MSNKPRTIRRTYEKQSANFPPELESALHRIIKTSSFGSILANARKHLLEYIVGDDFMIDTRALKEGLCNPTTQSSPVGFAIGDYVYRKLGEEILKEYFLTNDIAVVANGSNWKFVMRSLSKHVLKGGNAVYYSTRSPKVNINGNFYTAAYTKHTLERIHRRTKAGLYNYAALGDAFSFSYENQYFEPAMLKDGTHAFSIFGMCGDENCQPFEIVRAIFGEEYFPDENYYYRLGYMPVEIVGDFAVMKTLLCPGYLQTPEYSALKRTESNHEWSKRANENERRDAIQAYDLELIKKMHCAGILQVRSFEKSIFKFR